MLSFKAIAILATLVSPGEGSTHLRNTKDLKSPEMDAFLDDLMGGHLLVDPNCCGVDDQGVGQDRISTINGQNETCFELYTYGGPGGDNAVNVGEVCVSTDSDDIGIEYALYTEGTCSWRLNSVSAWIGLEDDGFPQTPTGNPKVDEFPLQQTVFANDMLFEFLVLLCDISVGDFSPNTAQCCMDDEVGNSEKLYMMARAEVSLVCDDGSISEPETAWTEGGQVVTRGNWATQNDFSIICAEDTTCFPKDAMAEVQGKGIVQMQNLELGDKVRSENGFSEIYAFATRVEDKVPFYKLTTTSKHTIELSGNHMIFVGKDMEPKLASDVKKGDELMLMPDKVLSKVRSIKQVIKKGAVHPLTYDGTVVVNGVLASAHSADLVAPVVKLGDHYIIDMHQFQQMVYAPLRLLCKLSRKTFCTETNHWRGDSHHYVDALEYLENFLMPESDSVDDHDIKQEYDFLQASALVSLRAIFLFWVATTFLLEQLLTHSTIALVLAMILSLRFLKVFKVKKLQKKKVD